MDDDRRPAPPRHEPPMGMAWTEVLLVLILLAIVALVALPRLIEASRSWTW